MPTFIKAGLWKKAKKALEGELNLTSLIQSLIPPPVPPEATYKVYTAIISQTGTNAPVVETLLENTLGGTVTFSYSGVGEYYVNSSNLFTGAGSIGAANKTAIIISPGRRTGNLCVYGTTLGGPSVLVIYTYNNSGTSTNGIMTSTLLEIRVYN